MSRAHFDAPSVYSSEIQRFGGQWLGHALWYPTPPEGEEVAIGDVGYIYQGRFIKLFNVVDPDGFPDDKRPEGFEPLTYHANLRDDRLFNFNPPSIHSESITILDGNAAIQAQTPVGPSVNAGISFQSTGHQGAILYLKTAPFMASVCPNECFSGYFKRHHDSWIRYMKETSMSKASSTDIVLVSGSIKSSEWAIAAFQSRKYSRGTSLTASFAPAQNAEFSLSFSQAHRPMYTCHSYPFSTDVALEAETPLPRNQCIFLRYYKIRFRLPLTSYIKLKAAAGPAPLPDRPPEDDSQGVLSNDDMEVETEAPGPTEEVISPLDVLLDYIIENSDAEVAIAGQGELEILFDSDAPSDIPNYLRTCQPDINIDADKVGTLSLESMILGKQRRRRAQQDEGGRGHSSTRALATTTLSERVVFADERTLEWLDIVLRARGESNASIKCYFVSNNGQHILTGLTNGTIKLWALCTGLHIRDFAGHDKSVLSVTFSPDDAKFISGSEDSTAMLWEVNGETVVSTMRTHDQSVRCVAWSSDGATIATGSKDQTACLWYPDGAKRSSLQHDGQVTLLEFSPGGHSLLTIANSVASLWDCGSSNLCFTLTVHSGSIWSTRFSASGDRIITVFEDGAARIWDARSGDELVVLRRDVKIWAAEFSPDGQHVATGSLNGQIVLCDPYGSDEKFDMTRAPLAHISALAYSHSGEYIASGNAGGLVRLWDGKSGSFMAEFHGHEEIVKSLAWTPDDKFVVSSSRDGTVRVWNILDVVRLLCTEGDSQRAAVNRFNAPTITVSESGPRQAFVSEPDIPNITVPKSEPEVHIEPGRDQRLTDRVYNPHQQMNPSESDAAGIAVSVSRRSLGAFIFHTFNDFPNIPIPGIVVPQLAYSNAQPYTQRPHVPFWVNGLRGIRLIDALSINFAGLHNAASMPELTDTDRLSCRIQWPGYESWNTGLHVIDNSGQRYNLTRVAYAIAKAVQQFLTDTAHVQSTEQRPDWWISNVRLDKLYLVEIRHVSRGSWQPVLCYKV